MRPESVTDRMLASEGFTPTSSSTQIGDGVATNGRAAKVESEATHLLAPATKRERYIEVAEQPADAARQKFSPTKQRFPSARGASLAPRGLCRSTLHQLPSHEFAMSRLSLGERWSCHCHVMSQRFLCRELVQCASEKLEAAPVTRHGRTRSSHWRIRDGSDMRRETRDTSVGRTDGESRADTDRRWQ